MASEIKINNPDLTGKTLYAVRFNSVMQPFVTNGSSNENWSAADTYDVTLSEVGSGGGAFEGDFDASSNIAEGVYPTSIYEQAGANPANGDSKVGSLTMDWTGAAERSVAAVLIGTPANIDGGGATIADNLKKLADDNNGADFDATTDSLEVIAYRVGNIKAQTDQIDFTEADPSTGKGEVISTLSSTGLDAVDITEPSGRASNFREMIVQLFMRFFNKVNKNTTTITTYDTDGNSVTEQSYTSSGGVDTVNKATDA